MPYKHAPYASLEEAMKNKRSIFGDDIATAIHDCAKALAAGDDAEVSRIVHSVRPARRENVRVHAADLLEFFR